MPRVVVLEDDPVVRNLVVRILEMVGFTVQAFEDAGAALEEVAWRNVDLVVSDMRMPTPGDIAVRTLRERGIGVPIIIMSGHLDDGRLLGLDIQGTIAKPFKISEFTRVVNEVLQRGE